MDFYALTRFSDNLDAFIDKDAYTSTWSTSLEFMNEPHLGSGLMIWMDPPEHNRYRGLVSKAFTPRRIADLEPRIRAIATGYLDALVGRERFDVVKEFTARLPMDVISSLLGIPESDRRWVQEGSNAMLHRDPGNPLPRPEAIEATQRGARLLRRADRRAPRAPARRHDDAAHAGRVRGRGRQHRAALGPGHPPVLVLLATAGNETVTKLLATAYYELWRNPGRVRAARARTRARAQRGRGAAALRSALAVPGPRHDARRRRCTAR